MSKKTILISLACLIGAGVLFAFIGPYVLIPLFGYGSDPRNTSVEDILQYNLMKADRTPGWSADGQSIVANIGHSIYVITTSDLSLRRILPERDGQYYSPSLSRNGRVAYIRHEFVRTAIFREKDDSWYSVETVDLTRDEVKSIRWTYHDMRPPLISPDGARIWMVSSGTRIYDNQGNVVGDLDVFSAYGAWSNDGEKIAYIDAKWPENGPANTPLVVVDWYGNNEVVIPGGSGRSYWTPPAWSPDDKRLYYAYRPEGSEPTAIHVADLDSGTGTTIAELGTGIDVLHIATSPDGKNLLLITSLEKAVNQIWLIYGLSAPTGPT